MLHSVLLPTLLPLPLLSAFSSILTLSGSVLAQLPIGGSNPDINNAAGSAASAGILGGAEAISTTVSQSWDRTWDVALSGGLYGAINNIAIFLAAGALVFWLLDFVRKLLSDEVNGVWALQDLIWPIVIILFTANNGSLLAGFSRGFRDTLNDFNLQVVRVVAKEQDLEKTLNELGAYAVVDAKLATARGQCNTITDNKKLTECLDEQNKALQGILKQYQQEYGATVKYKQLEASVKNAVRNPGEAITDGVRSGVNGSVNLALSPAMALVIVFMAACQYCFQQLIEVSMLLTAIMGPLALAASLLPFGAKPIFAWLTAFWSLSVLKLSYNIIAGLTAIAIYQTSGTETLGSAIFFGLFSPLLALAMAAGGGLAVFNAVLAASGAGLGLAVGKLTGGGSGAATGGSGAAAAAASRVIAGSDGV